MYRGVRHEQTFTSHNVHLPACHSGTRGGSLYRFDPTCFDNAPGTRDGYERNEWNSCSNHVRDAWKTRREQYADSWNEWNRDNRGGTIILAEVTFQRPNQALWGMSSDGRSWEGDANALAAFSIADTMGQIAKGQGALNAVLGVVNSNVEVVVQGSIDHYNGTAVNLGVVLRWTNTNNWYKLLIDADTLSILKRQNGVSSTLASLPFQAKDGVGYTLRFRALGATLFAKAWPSDSTEPTNWMLLTNDTALTGGQTGIRVLVQPSTVVHITSFLATEATVGV